jgi:hypothetical protein|tara:strand:+ start:226 stop:447 length:222 start_codon:yes stop_codon:yes gene_type:complete
MAISRITSQSIADGTITNSDISATAAIVGTKLGGTTFPFYKSNGNASNITLANNSSELPFYKADGNANNIGVL